MRYCSVQSAPKRGRGRLRKVLPSAVYADLAKSGGACLARYELSGGEWLAREHVVLDSSLPTALAAYLLSIDGSVLAAWNMKGHDRHVLERAVGETVLSGLGLWDPLPWFRSHWGLPKNTLSSCKPGTPRAVFGVNTYGPAHDSMVDAAHMRDVVTRAAYGYPTKDADAWKTASGREMLDAVRAHVEAD